MAGQGKGPLRIALEDFLETFDLGKALHSWYVTVLEKFEDEAIAMYKDFYDAFEYKEFIPPIYTPGAIGSRIAKRPVQIVPILLGVVMMVIGAFIGVFDPVRRIATYKVDRLAKSGRPSPIEAWAMAKRLEGTQGDPSEILKDLGLDATLIKGYETLSQDWLSPLEYISAWRRGHMSDSEMVDKLRRLSVPQSDIDLLLNITQIIPNVGDLIRMAVREAFTPEIIERFQYGEAFPTGILEHTRKQGLPDDWVKRYWYAHWELPSPTAGYEMLHRLRPGRSDVTFTENDLDLLLRTADYAPYFRDRLKAISYNPITRVDVRRMYKLGVFNAEEVKERYKDLGYTDQDAERLKEFTVKYESEQGASELDKITNLSASLAKRLYMKGVIEEGEYRARLSTLKYAPDVINLLVELANQELKEDLTPDYRKEFISDMKGDIERAFSARMITEQTARETLASLGLTTDNIDIIIQKEKYQADLNSLNYALKLLTNAYTSRAITRESFIGELGRLNISGSQQTQIISDLELENKYRAKGLSESQYRAATLAGILTEEDYRKGLEGLGYTDQAIDTLIKLYLSEEA